VWSISLTLYLILLLKLTALPPHFIFLHLLEKKIDHVADVNLQDEQNIF